MKEVLTKKKLRFWLFTAAMVVLFGAVIAWIFIPANDVTAAKKQGGLNMHLPGANVSGDSAKDKLSFYSLAMQDSMKRDEAMKMDPYRRDTVVRETPVAKERLGFGVGHADGDQLAAKIKSIQRQLSVSKQNDYEEDVARQNNKAVVPVEPDPEIAALNNTLEKLLEVQHPERVAEKVKEKKITGLAISMRSVAADESFFGSADTLIQAGFLEGNGPAGKPTGTVSAVVHGTQVLQSGSLVKLRLLTEIFVNGVHIPVNHFIYGISMLDGERLHVFIPSIQFNNRLFPVSLTVYDMDGLEGIYIPGSVERDVAKQSAEQGLQSVNVLSMDPSLKSQAVAAGIGAAKSLLSKKVRLVRVTIKSGYRVLIRDENEKESK